MIDLFEEIGVKYELAENGEQGIQKVMEIHPDLILMDMHMPGMNGLEATRQIRSQSEFKELPIIALSADAFTEQQQEALSAGVTDYLTKPVDLELLVSKLNQYLGR